MTKKRLKNSQSSNPRLQQTPKTDDSIKTPPEKDLELRYPEESTPTDKRPDQAQMEQMVAPEADSINLAKGAQSLENNPSTLPLIRQQFLTALDVLIQNDYTTNMATHIDKDLRHSIVHRRHRRSQMTYLYNRSHLKPQPAIDGKEEPGTLPEIYISCQINCGTY